MDVFRLNEISFDDEHPVLCGLGSDLRARLVQLVTVAGTQRNRGALSGQRHRSGFADAPAGAANDCHATSQAEVHG